MTFLGINSIHHKFVLALTLVVTIIILMVSVFYINYTARQNRLELHHEMQTLLSLAGKGLSSPLWQYNSEAVNGFLASLFQYKNLIYAGVMVKNKIYKEILHPEYTRQMVDPSHQSSKFIKKSRPIYYQETPIGEITLILTQEGIQREILLNSLGVIFLLVLVLLAITITIYLQTRIYIFSPMKRLEAAARKIAQGDFDSQIKIERNDEFGRLSSDLNLMIQRLKRITTSRDELNHEIKERETAEQKLVKTLRLLNTTEKISSSGSWEYNIETGEEVWSEGEYRILQRPRTQNPEHQKRLDSIHPDDRKDYQSQFLENLASGKTGFSQEIRIITQKGKVRFVRTDAEVIKDEDGAPLLVRGIDFDISERKQNQEILEKQLTSLLQAEQISRLGYFDRNWETDGAYWSHGVFSLLGIDKKEEGLTHEAFLTHIHPGDRERFSRELKQSIKTGTVHDTQFRLIQKDKGLIHVRILADHFYTSKGTPSRTCGVIQDITGIIDAESQLWELNIRFSLALETAGLGVWEMNLETGRLFFDRKMLEFYGYTREDFSNTLEAWKKRIHPQDREAAMASSLNPGKNTPETFFRLLLPTGEIRYVSSSSVLISDEKGKPNRIIGIHQDITGQQRAKQDLSRLAKAIDQVEESVVITDVRGKISYVNPAFEKVTGYSQNEAIGQTPQLLKSGAHDRAFYKDLWQTILSKRTWKGRFQNRKKCGNTYIENATISPILDEKGKISNFVAVKRDISKEIETEKQLQQAQKMESIGTLAGGIAHDFNNILTSIIGFAELALRNAEKESVMAEDIQEILIAGMRAKDLVMQILTFARQTEDTRHPISVSAIAKEVVRFIRASIPATIAIRQSVNTKARVLADPSHLHQIFMNLFTNAAQAMEENGGELSLHIDELTDDEITSSGVKLDKNRKWILTRVEDTGTGIPESDLDQIFEPYFSTKPQGEGTGLGLSVVYGAVRNMGGNIHVHSKPGKGTVFSLYFPISKEKKITPRDILPDVTVFGRETILVVDDEPPVTKLTRRFLEQQGYSVIEQNDPLEAYAYFKAHPTDIDLVITDMTMPLMTGELLAKKILDIRPDLPIICCTGYSKKIDDQSAKKMGISLLIKKPIGKSSLMNGVQTVLSNASGGKSGLVQDGKTDEKA